MPDLSQLQSLLAADPADAFLRYAVAMELAKLGQLTESLAQFAELLQRHPNYVPAYFMAGRTCEQNADIPAAKSYYLRGIETAQRTGDSHAAAEIADALAALD